MQPYRKLTQQLSRKKQVELNYIEEARRASSIFPIGELVPREEPDFLLHTDSVTIGIEVTELCREEPRAKAGRLTKVPVKAHGIYSGLANAQPVGVFVLFSKQAENVRFDALTTSLAEFVYANRSDAGHFYKKDHKDLPEGYSYIGIQAWTPKARWHSGQSSETAPASRERVESLITEKTQRLQAYRLSVSVVWLLIVNDLFLGPGEVYARPDDLAKWNFTFDFDKVLLFSRQPGGGGNVIEIQRSLESFGGT